MKVAQPGGYQLHHLRRLPDVADLLEIAAQIRVGIELKEDDGRIVQRGDRLRIVDVARARLPVTKPLAQLLGDAELALRIGPREQTPDQRRADQLTGGV